MVSKHSVLDDRSVVFGVDLVGASDRSTIDGAHRLTRAGREHDVVFGAENARNVGGSQGGAGEASTD